MKKVNRTVKLKSILPILLAAATFINQANAQQKNPYNYQELSNFFYAKQRDSLRKNWICPTLYSDKATQKQYNEI